MKPSIESQIRSCLRSIHQLEVKILKSLGVREPSAGRVLHGIYIGGIRSLPLKLKSRVRRIHREKGVKAAIREIIRIKKARGRKAA